MKCLSEKIAWKVVKNQKQLTPAKELDEETELQPWTDCPADIQT